MDSNSQFTQCPFKANNANLEQTLERFEKYLKNMDRVFRIKRARTAASMRIEFENDEKKDIIQIKGRSDYRGVYF